MKLLPIQKTIEENQDFRNNPDCADSLEMSINFFNKIGYNPPWIGYYVEKNGKLVGTGAYKGITKDKMVEIAYGVFPKFQHKGIGTEICKMLVELALNTDPSVKITARTLPEENYSTKILRKNDFILLGTVWDAEDGDVWEWVYKF